MTPVLGDPNVTAFLKALSLHQFCSTCTPTTCQFHVAENSFTLTTYVSPFEANCSANWSAVSCQIWRGCHTSVDSGDLNQAPPKQSAVCFTCIIPAPLVNCQFIWMASAFGMSATQPCLGVTLDRTLSYRVHLTKTTGKLTNRNNLLMKLAGSTWGASANTLRSSALALCYSAAEYYASVWSRFGYTSQVDVQLNSTVRLLSGTLRSTPLPWLPVLSNIEPPALRRNAASEKLVETIVKRDSWSIQPDILSQPLLRLTSRKPLWLDFQPVDIKSRWRHNWKSSQVVISYLVVTQQSGNQVSTSLGNSGLC